MNSNLNVVENILPNWLKNFSLYCNKLSESSGIIDSFIAIMWFRYQMLFLNGIYKWDSNLLYTGFGSVITSHYSF